MTLQVNGKSPELPIVDSFKLASLVAGNCISQPQTANFVLQKFDTIGVVDSTKPCVSKVWLFATVVSIEMRFDFLCVHDSDR